MFVYHPEDNERAEVVDDYRGLLVDPEASFVDAPLDRVLDAWRHAVQDAQHEAWLERFRLRYLDSGAAQVGSGME